MGFFKRVFGMRGVGSGSQGHNSSDTNRLFPEWAAFFGTPERYQRFDALVREYFERRGGPFVMENGMVTVRPSVRSGADSGQGERTFGLGNIGQMCALEPMESWKTLISQHFDAVETGLSTPDSLVGVPFEQVKQSLGVRLWDRNELTVTARALWREELPGIASVLCLDEPRAVRTLREEDIGQWGHSPDALFDIAMNNLSALAPVQLHATEIGKGLTIHEILGESFFTATWALRTVEWPQISGAHGMFLSVPSRHRVLALPLHHADSIAALGQMIQITVGLEQEGPGSISSRVFWKRGATTVEIPYSFEAQRLNVRPPDQFVRYLESIVD